MALLTSDFKINQANYFIDNINTEDVFFFGGQILNVNTTTVNSTVQDTFYNVHNNMIFGQYITEDNYNAMIPRVDWVSNTVYTEYDHEADLEGSSFYVSTFESSAYSVFKCLDNNKGVASTDKPLLSETSPGDAFYQTSDGYIWKLMYTVDQTTYDKFATDSYMPFIANVAVSNSAVSGAIDVVKVTDAGSGYKNTANGVITTVAVGGNSRKFYIDTTSNTALSANAGYYTDCAVYITSGDGAGQQRSIIDYGTEGSDRFIIVDTAFTTGLSTSSNILIAPEAIADGDGTGFQGHVVVDTSDFTLDYVEVVNSGTDYTYATMTIGSNTAAINTASYSAGSLRAIIPPFGGHGFDAQEELFGKYVCITDTFSGNTVPAANNDYRTFGIIQNPTFRTAKLDIDTVSGLSIGDTITQANTGATGTIDEIDSSNTTITLTDVSGIFNTTDIVEGNTTFTVSSVLDNNDFFDQRTNLDVNIVSGSGFEKDELVIQDITEAQGYVHSYSGTNLYLVNTVGDFQASANNEITGQESSTVATINTVTNPELQKHSGKILYIERFDPITRLDSQSETVKLVIGF